MTTIILIIHVFVCFFLISIVLLQSGKGAELGAAFGGSSQTLFGSRGAATFLNKLTTIVAVVFMITSLMLAVLAIKGGSIIKNTPIKAAPVTEEKTIPVTSGPAREKSTVPIQPSEQKSQPQHQQQNQQFPQIPAKQ